MVKKLLNIEIPVWNKQNVFTDLFLKGLKYLIPIRNFVDITILYNGPNINDELIHKSNDRIKNMGFNLYWDQLPTGHKLEHNIVQLREYTHQISKKDYPLILQLDDDIEILSFKYVKILSQAIQIMLSNEKIGVSIFATEHSKNQFINLIDEQQSICTNGGLLLKNIKKWNSLYPIDARNLIGPQSDILVTYVRFREGFAGLNWLQVPFRHFENTNIERGSQIHKWYSYKNEPEFAPTWLGNNVTNKGQLSKQLIQQNNSGINLQNLLDSITINNYSDISKELRNYYVK